MRQQQARPSIGVVLGLVTLLTRLPFTSQYLYHWDLVNFAMAIQHYDIVKHQPQPPGYVLYILAARLVNFIVSDANLSLVIISIVFSVLMIMAVYWLGTSLFGEGVGIVSAILALTSPMVWFHSEVALSYIVEGFFVALIGLMSYKVLTGDRRYVLPLAFVLGLAGGFRQNTLVFLFPLWLYTWRSIPWRLRILASLVLALTVAAWAAEMIYLSGGLDAYITAMANQSSSNLTISAQSGIDTLAVNGLRLFMYNVYALPLGLPILLIAGLYALRYAFRIWRDIRVHILLIWILPGLTFYIFFVQQAGYIFTIFPAIIVIVALTSMKVIPSLLKRSTLPVASGLATILILANLAFFFGAPPFLFNDKRQVLNTTSWPAIHSRNVILHDKIDYIRANFPPEQSMILADQFDFRIPAYYLPNYHRIDNFQGKLDTADLNGIEYLILFNKEIDLDLNLDWQTDALPYDETLRWTELAANVES